MAHQLSIFEPQFDDKIRRVDHEGIEYFSCVDLMSVFAETEQETRKYWNDTKKRIEEEGFQLSDRIRQLKLKSRDGKTYLTDCATGGDCVRILTSVRSPKEEIKFKIEELRQWLGVLGYERMEEAKNPELGEHRARQRSIESYRRAGKDDTYIQKRLKSLDKRNDFTAVAQETHVSNKPDYMRLTSITYKGVFGMVKTEMVRAIGLTEKEALKFRDHLNVLAVDAIGAAESAASMKMAMTGRQSLTTDEQIEIALECARRVAPSFWSVAQYIGIDLVTGKPLLSAIN